MPSISVIMPVYQAEKFLKASVESVLTQTFSDWELLLVDDGCRDGSPALCDGFAAQDDRVRVIHKRKNSSMIVGLKMLADGDADAFVSAGSTGALLTGATLLIKRVKGKAQKNLAIAQRALEVLDRMVQNGI